MGRGLWEQEQMGRGTGTRHGERGGDARGATGARGTGHGGTGRGEQVAAVDGYLKMGAME